MIIVKIIGGFGNQLFQYAAGKRIAVKHQVPLKLDISDFSNYNLRTFELFQLGLHFETASTEEIEKMIPSSAFLKALQYLKPKSARTFYRERSFHYDKDFENIGPNAYLKGYFQSWKYFYPIADILRKELTINPVHLKTIEGITKDLQKSNSVAVHIRRGDYNNKEALQWHGVMNIEYYQKAMDIIASKISNPVFYFFSDDIDWVQQNLKPRNAVYVSGIVSQTHFEDLYLMSHCKHNIIANSSFSWWGAWLNESPDKIVIGPKNWFDRGPKDTYDILPEEWILV